MQQRMGSLEVYRQGWRLYRQTRIRYRRLKRLDFVRLTFKQSWADAKDHFLGGDSLDSHRHQCDTFLDLMSMQVMLLEYEGQTQPFEVMQEQIAASQKHRRVLSSFLERRSIKNGCIGALWLMMFLLGFVGLLELQPNLRPNNVFESARIGYAMAHLITSISVLFCMEWLRRASYIGQFSTWVVAFYSKYFQPEEVFQCLLKEHKREIRLAAGICCLADWLPLLTGLALMASPNVWVLVLPASLSVLFVVKLLIIHSILMAFVILWLVDRVFAPFRYAVCAVVYSNWRSQHWQKG